MLTRPAGDCGRAWDTVVVAVAATVAVAVAARNFRRVMCVSVFTMILFQVKLLSHGSLD
jgi:branched-subunit amino acid transport protein